MGRGISDHPISCVCPQCEHGDYLRLLETTPEERVKKSELTGGSANYYKVNCTDDEGEEYIAECKHIVNAKNMNFNMANVFKACFRLGDKQNTSVKYDLEKNIFFTVEELRRQGFIKDNDEAIEMFKKIIGVE